MNTEVVSSITGTGCVEIQHTRGEKRLISVEPGEVGKRQIRGTGRDFTTSLKNDRKRASREIGCAPNRRRYLLKEKGTLSSCDERIKGRKGWTLGEARCTKR